MMKEQPEAHAVEVATSLESRLALKPQQAGEHEVID
jgi:hypothetical protein